ncbi:MAG: DUF3179 domain-containing protein [Planctomycetota bacterium]
MTSDQLPTGRTKRSLAALLMLLAVALGAWWYATRPNAAAPEAANATAGDTAVGGAVAGGTEETAQANAKPPRRRSAKASFDLSALTLPTEKVRGGGPPKDGIPSLTSPEFVAAGDAAFMKDEDLVIGVALGDQAKAYPLKILDHHEAVNDTVGGKAVAVTYCPLCDSSIVFDRERGGEAIELGVSGLLYNSNVLLYDRGEEGKESLWSQMGSRAVSGPAVGSRLPRLPLEVTSWAAWRERRPDTLVLSRRTGHKRTYNRSVYARYFKSPRVRFPLDHQDDRLPPKTPVLGVVVGDQARAFPVAAVIESGEERLTAQLAGKQFTLVANPAAKSVRIEAADEGVEWVYAFWFAWAAFQPETVLWAAEP